MTHDPQTRIDFIQHVADHYHLLTKSERLIADYLRRNQDEAAFLSAAELAKRLSLSEATIVRFARTIGFEGYPAMHEALQANFRNMVTHSTRLRSRLDDLVDGGNIFEKLVASEITFLTEALHTLDMEAFQAAVELLRTHARIFVFGMGPSVSLVDLLEIRLTRFAKHVIPLRSSGREILEPLLLMNETDLLIVIAFFDVSPTLRLVLEHAHQTQTPVLLITDTLGPLVAEKTDVILAARRGPVASYHSLTVPMTILNALLLTLVSVDQAHVTTHLDKLDHARERLQKLTAENYP